MPPRVAPGNSGPTPHRRAWLAAASVLLVLLGWPESVRAHQDGIRGLPFSRVYPLEEIGNVSRGARLSFDDFGRLVVVQDGVYAVLNDTVWVDLADRSVRGGTRMANVVQGADGRSYYGARGSWGTVELAPNGRRRPLPLATADAPKWTQATSLDHLVVTSAGVYFAGWNGIVFWDYARRENRYFEFSGVAEIFRIGDRVYVSSHGRPLHLLDVAQGVLQAVPGTDFGRSAVEFAAALDDQRTLLAVRDGRLVEFDGHSVSPWEPQARHDLVGAVAGLQRLVDGGIAVAITGRGLFLVGADGGLIAALTTPQYHRIMRLASREPGVLWLAGEDAVEKLLYGSPLSVFGQRLGLPLSWPIVARWNDRLLVTSSGQLYEAIPGPAGAPSRFAAMKTQPPGGAWAIATRGEQLLVGNASGVLAPETDGRFTSVMAFEGVAHLVMDGADHCFVIGEAQIGVLRWQAGRWVEAAARIRGSGFPSVVQRGSRSVWIEYGGGRVGRLTLTDGELKLQVIEAPAWKESRWVNVGNIGDLAILSGAVGDRHFFDERSGAFVAAPAVQRLLERSPHWITRVREDETGILWASHDRGVVTFAPQGEDYAVDTSTFDLISDLYPIAHVLPGNDVWFTGGRSLYRVDRSRIGERRAPLRPMLVSVIDGRTNAELVLPREPAPFRLPFARNSLSFRFFSGGYAWRRTPGYEFRLNANESWAQLGSGSVLSFSELREGRYRLEVRMADGRVGPATPVAYDFEILPPWYRTTLASVLSGLAVVLAVWGLLRWSSHQARQRNLALAQLVRQRTDELKATMEKLNEETRNSATLAERDRLAGEIHDSLQQGLSGLMLQLDATLKLPAVAGDVRARLLVARNMVSFTRHEVQHAVWDLESPLLEDADLDGALRKLAALVNSGIAAIEVEVTGAAIRLPSTLQHHLLRIAQEAMSNAVRHSSARRITVRLEYGPEACTLAVVDDGVGFHTQEALAGGIGHFGLRGMRGRAGKIGGDLQIRSAPGRGTEIRIAVPLRPRAQPTLDATTCAA